MTRRAETRKQNKEAAAEAAAEDTARSEAMKIEDRKCRDERTMQRKTRKGIEAAQPIKNTTTIPTAVSNTPITLSNTEEHTQ